jgi:hypothetical protein
MPKSQIGQPTRISHLSKQEVPPTAIELFVRALVPVGDLRGDVGAFDGGS